MSAQAQSRRAFILAGSALASTGALAGVAVTAAPDPVFALIEAERAAWQAFNDAITVLDRTDVAFRESGFDRKPRVQTGTMTSVVDDDFNPIPVDKWPTTPIYVHTHDEIDREYDRRERDFLAGRWKPETKPGGLVGMEEGRARAHRALDNDEAAIEAAKVQCGVPAALVAERETDEAARIAEEAVYAVTPTTVAGLLAVLALFEERQADWMSSPLDGYVTAVFASVRTLVAGAVS